MKKSVKEALEYLKHIGNLNPMLDDEDTNLAIRTVEHELKWLDHYSKHIEMLKSKLEIQSSNLLNVVEDSKALINSNLVLKSKLDKIEEVYNREQTCFLTNYEMVYEIKQILGDE